MPGCRGQRRKRKIITPAVEARLRDYFYRGYTAADMHDFLRLDGILVSYSYLRSEVLPRMGLVKRPRHRPPPLTVIDAVREATVEGPNALASTSTVTHALRVDQNLNIIRADVAAAQRALAPDLVDARRTGRLRRRTYQTQGSSYIWHADGYDKLAPYGLAIHGCVDGFSRFIVWLKLSTTNHRPDQTCLHFIDAVEEYGLPHTVRLDAGTENTRIGLAQRYLSEGLPRLTPLGPVITGSSNHNERIERFWGILRLKQMNFWINHFKELVAQGQMVAWDATDRKVSYYVYHSLVRQILDKFREEHNDHRIRSQRNPEITTGKPTVMFLLPERYGHANCVRFPPQLHIDYVRATLTDEVHFDAAFQRILDDLVEQYRAVYPPRNVVEADRLYIQLRAEMRARQN